MDPVELIKGFKYIMFKEFRAAEGEEFRVSRHLGGPERSVLFLLRGSATILKMLYEKCEKYIEK